MKKPVFVLLLTALLIAALLSPFASSKPDGLDRAAGDLGFQVKANENGLLEAVFPDYKISGMQNEFFATSLAGVLGVLLTFTAAYVLGKIVSKRGKNPL